MITIAILNLKGGVGKTTISMNLGAALSRLGKKVLLVDMDSQNDLTQNLGLNPATTKGVEFLITNDIPLKMLLEKYDENLHFIPSGKKLKELELSLSKLYKKKPKSNYLLKYMFNQYHLDYDYVIFDCANTTGLLNFNVLTLVKNVFIPVQCHMLGLRGSKRTLFFVNKIEALYNSGLRIAGIIPAMYDARNSLSGRVIKEMEKTYDGLVLNTKIRVNVSLAESPAFGKTIFDYKPHSRGAQDFHDLANEVLVMFEEIY
ncbi:hypothetical protein B1H10_08135 [candidate division KSB1 bacterium 4484_188]|nr:MAG: hypothetical protein B1H10_08135 [candidate division KSB1 bacterium 4484_188]HFE64796.1 ParA family protein [Caldithrix sp.]